MSDYFGITYFDDYYKIITLMSDYFGSSTYMTHTIHMTNTTRITYITHITYVTPISHNTDITYMHAHLHSSITSPLSLLTILYSQLCFTI